MQPNWFSFQQHRRCVLIIDVVESVRHILRNEHETIGRWLEVVDHVKTLLKDVPEGKLVKSLGDGMLLQFTDPKSALKVAFGCMEFARSRNEGLPDDRQLHLRMGLEVTEVIVGEDDIYGHGVNMAARLTTLAKPGEIVISAAVRDELTPELDADVEDMGECFLKHIEEPVRAYRVGPPGHKPVLLSPESMATMLPTLAVVPFENRSQVVLGEIVAEELIRTLSQSDRVNVISRLSTRAFRNSALSAQQIGKHLKANYVLNGTCSEIDGQVLISLELSEVRSDTVIWSERFNTNVAGLLKGNQDFVAAAVAQIGQAILKREFERARTLPLPTIESYGLLLGAIASMYRLSRSEFERAGEMLEHLIDQAPRQPLPLAWMGNWHVLKVQQGWADDGKRERQLAHARTSRALDLDSENAQALTIDGFVQTNLFQDFDAAEDRYDRAISSNPNLSLAWLLRGMMHAFRGEGEQAVQYSNRAQALSPIDPQRFFYDSLTAAAYIAAGRSDEAEAIALRSLKANTTHTSTLRTLAIAQWESGKHEAARDTVRKLMAMEPGLTISGWLKQNPAGQFKHGRNLAEILTKAGVPK